MCLYFFDSCFLRSHCFDRTSIKIVEEYHKTRFKIKIPALQKHYDISQRESGTQ